MQLRISSALSMFFGLLLVISFTIFVVLMMVYLRANAIGDLNSKFHAVLNLNEKIFNEAIDDNLSRTNALSEDYMIIKAFVDLNTGFQSSNRTNVKKIYQPKDPQKDRSKIIIGSGAEIYEFMHEAHHKQIIRYLNTSFFSDILLINKNGTTIYSFRKEREFLENISVMAQDINKMRVLDQLIKTTSKTPKVASGLFKINDKEVGLISTIPIKIKNKFVGHVATVMPFNYFNNRLNDIGSIGKTGSIIITNKKGEKIAWKENINTKLKDWAVPQSILTSSEGKPDISQEIKINDRYFHVLYKKLQIAGLQFFLILQQADAEIFASSNALQVNLALIGAAILILSLISVIMISRKISSPLSTITFLLKKISDGQAKEIEEIKTRFIEINKISDSLIIFRDAIMQREWLVDMAKSEQEAEAIKQEELGQMISQFRFVMSQSLDSIAQKSEEMKSKANVLLQAVDVSTAEADTARTASQEASANVQSVASSADQLSQSIHKISSHTKRANEVVSCAKNAADSTNGCVADLTQATEEIGNVIEVIKGVSEKTNLLALNATIEAARAGDAGKGFSVVATEVKQLSNEAAKAIDEITNQITQVTRSTQDAVELIKTISNSIYEIETVTTSIVAAVEQQDGATKHIASQASSASTESEKATVGVNGAAQNIEKTTEVASTVLTISEDFSAMADKLSDLAENFLKEISDDLENRKKDMKDPDVSLFG